MKVNIDEIAKIGTFPSELKDVIVARIKEVNVWGIVTGKQIGRASCRERVLRLV